MAILILANHRANERKHGLYPTVVKYHDNMGVQIFLHLIGQPGQLGPYTDTDARALNSTKPVGFKLPKLDAFIFASLRFRADLRQIRQHISEHGKPELIVALTSSPISGTLAYIAGREHNVPFVVWEHLTHYQRNMLTGFRLMRRKIIMNKATKVLAVSSSLSKAIQHTIDLNVRHIEVVPNPIPADFTGDIPSVSEKYKNLINGNFLFGAWTNWRKIKRLDLLLEAFKILKTRHPEARLVIAGPISEEMSNKIGSDLLTQDGVIFLDAIPRREIRDLARIVDCCVVPSDHETFGLPALEAIAMGKPVVTTKSGGPEHLITPQNGLVIGKNSAPEMAEAMLCVINNYQRYNPVEISVEAYKTYGPDAIKDCWRKLYQSLKVETVNDKT